MLIVLSALALFIALALIGNYNIQQMHSGGFYRTDDVYENLGPVVYYEEGLYATVTVRELLGNNKALFINGKGQGSSAITDLRVNFLLAYLPELIRPETENALVIGLGTGTTSGQLSQIRETTTVEIEPEVLGAVPYFSNFNQNVLSNENHELIIGDGRNYLLKNEEKYGVIVPEPSDPWQSFSTNLFSKEFFELAASDLNDNGLYLQWVPIYQMTPENFKSVYKTFNEVFPHNVAFANIKPTENTPVVFETSEIILIGSKSEFETNGELFEKNYRNLPAISKQKLNAIKLESGSEVHSLVLFTDEQMEGYANNAELITDNNPVLEFSTAKNVYTQNPQIVIKDIENYLESKNA